MTLLHAWPSRPPAIDTKAVGVSFVDVLFALVIARLLEPFADLDRLTGPGATHLVVAGVLTLTSWVGYHNSLNRPKYFIQFPNLPLFQFVLDIGMVVVYWLTAATAESERSPGDPTATASPETILIAIAFVMYVLWDVVALRIRLNKGYDSRKLSEDLPARRHVTWYCTAVALVLALFTFLQDRETALSVYVVDGLLIALLVGFRLLKEYVTPSDHGLSNEERAERELKAAAAGSA